MPDTAALLADLVSKHAKDGKADLVGMSLGGYTSIYMAAKYPHLIGKGGLFLSGCGRPVRTISLLIFFTVVPPSSKTLGLKSCSYKAA
jgi:pimeloyl-ACP methyl ester carboxylesterase